MSSRLLLFAFVALSSWPAQAFAQDTPVVFVHGFRGDQHSWSATAARLQEQLAIRSYVAQLPWKEAFEAQASELQAQFGSLPASTIAVGHSNGGLVSRQWSAQHSLAGLLTVGTPNYGAPFVDHLHDVFLFNEALYNAVGLASGALAIDPSTWNVVYLWVQGALVFSQQVALDTLWGVIGLGLQASVPVTGQMSTGSYLINQLNSSANIARETAAIPRRAGLVYVARNYWMGGPMRAIDPDNADAFYYKMWASISIMEGAAAALSTYYPTNPTAMWIAHSLFNVAGWVRLVDPAWCWMVTNDSTCATWHDGILPVSHQMLSAAANLFVAGPAHVQEPKEAGPVQYALLDFIGVLRRGSATPPTTGGGSGDQLGPGQTLFPGQKRTSGDGRFELAFQGDGNLVLYRLADGAALWASGTSALGGEAAMQADGNFVVYNANGVPQWNSGTANYPGASLVVQNDGNVVLYDYYGYPIWATGTAE